MVINQWDRFPRDVFQSGLLRISDSQGKDWALAVPVHLDRAYKMVCIIWLFFFFIRLYSGGDQLQHLQDPPQLFHAIFKPTLLLLAIAYRYTELWIFMGGREVEGAEVGVLDSRKLHEELCMQRAGWTAPCCCPKPCSSSRERALMVWNMWFAELTSPGWCV